FQAEDGIRDRNVTGVQTCALPISGPQVRGRAARPHDARTGEGRQIKMKAIVQDGYGSPDALKLREIEKPVVGDESVLVRIGAARSEERRVGKECRGQLPQRVGVEE